MLPFGNGCDKIIINMYKYRVLLNKRREHCQYFRSDTILTDRLINIHEMLETYLFSFEIFENWMSRSKSLDIVSISLWLAVRQIILSHVYLFVHTKSTIRELGEVFNKDGFDQIGIVYCQNKFRLQIQAKHGFVFVLFVKICHLIAQRSSSNYHRKEIAEYGERLGSGYIVLFPELWRLQKVVERQKKRHESAKNLEDRHFSQIFASQLIEDLLVKDCKRYKNVLRSSLLLWNLKYPRFQNFISLASFIKWRIRDRFVSFWFSILLLLDIYCTLVRKFVRWMLN